MFSVLLFVSFSEHLPSLFKTLKQQADCTTLMKMCSQYAGTFSAASQTVPTGVSWPRDCVFCVNGSLLTEFQNLCVDASPPPCKGKRQGLFWVIRYMKKIFSCPHVRCLNPPPPITWWSTSFSNEQQRMPLPS